MPICTRASASGSDARRRAESHQRHAGHRHGPRRVHTAPRATRGSRRRRPQVGAPRSLPSAAARRASDPHRVDDQHHVERSDHEDLVISSSGRTTTTGPVHEYLVLGNDAQVWDPHDLLTVVPEDAATARHVDPARVAASGAQTDVAVGGAVSLAGFITDLVGMSQSSSIAQVPRWVAAGAGVLYRGSPRPMIGRPPLLRAKPSIATRPTC